MQKISIEIQPNSLKQINNPPDSNLMRNYFSNSCLHIYIIKYFFFSNYNERERAKNKQTKKCNIDEFHSSVLCTNNKKFI
jgi:hypothetical protein